MSIKFGQIDSKELFTIPNLITYFRVLCVPAFVALMAIGGIKSNFTLFYIALGVFFVAAGSDLIDGWIARKFNMQSGIGMALDPVADKLMHIAVLACLSLCTGLTPLGKDLVAKGVLSNPWFVHYAFVILIVAKELIQLCIAFYVIKKGATVKANWLGKVSSFTISVGVILGFFHNYVQYADWGILAWGIVLSYAAAFSYLADVVKQVKRISSGEMQAISAETAKENDIKAVERRKSGATGGIFSEDGDVLAQNNEIMNENAKEAVVENNSEAQTLDCADNSGNLNDITE
ncbi:MAG: CDP-alcohol phosphatidyltransferase family protein [Bacteroides sp.]|nr:CDP-alcohol phosphatidyltransferase family protein [Bacillota bacterium]MCM1394227.1 CDP-alcohol phosphatidyltransferase family protein [[Eubacterium] siraeum]MCM1455621.1 CDP-alcohol phosphatidyltransferase family protein [Bacteroides sp.]